jgi:enoyl-CoA hydratase/carnithine racemase
MEPDKSAVTSLVQVERVTEQVSVIRLNRPDRLNALSFPMVAALHDA